MLLSLSLFSPGTSGVWENPKNAKRFDLILTIKKPTIICLQETKLSSTDPFKAATFLPNGFSSFMCVDARGSRGGILTAWNASTFHMHSFIVRAHSLTIHFSSTVSNYDFVLTNVYAPADHRDSTEFLDHLFSLKPLDNELWCIIGDFNLVRGGQEKNNNNINAALCQAFNDTIHDLPLLELPLLDRLYTWSNKRRPPVLARLDRAFFNNAMNYTFPNSFLTSHHHSRSDHTPIVLTLSTTIPKPQTFRFENAWLLHNDFLPVALHAWHSVPVAGDAAGVVVASLKAVRREAKVWSRSKKTPPFLYFNCNFLILLYDYFEEHRDLSSGEYSFKILIVISM
jgi:exonuclease III